MIIEFIPPVRRLLAAISNLDERGKVQSKAIKSHHEAIQNLHSRLNRCNATGMDRAELQAFAQEWLPRFNQVMNTSEGEHLLTNIGDHIKVIHDLCIGRIGGKMPSLLLRVLTARSINEPTLDILEIGTMFGGTVISIYDCCYGLFDNIHFTVIDPLDSYYQRAVDPGTQIAPNPSIFRRNMARFDIPKSDYTMICKQSQNQQAIIEAAKRSYNLLIIDGDHSDFGVTNDYHAYHSMVREGGYIIFDDYGDDKWGVTSFIERELQCAPGIKLIGTGYRTAIFRVPFTHGEPKENELLTEVNIGTG